MRLIITEKPSMGRDVAAALKATKRGEGYLEGATDIVTWCVGHLVELTEPETYDPKFKSWRAEHLPIIPNEFSYRAATRTLHQFKIIKSLLNRKDIETIVNAADAGREGELIFDLVYTLAGCRKPVQRLWISSLTTDAIIEGFRNLKPATEYMGLRDSARARQQADWLVGLNATRAQTIKARRAGHDGMFSLGRVQTPTLALIVERDGEIKEFVPKDYYEVHADFKAPAGVYPGIWTNANGTRFDKREDAEIICAKVAGKPGIIEKLERKSIKERAPLLYDLTALQRAANVRFALSAAQVLEHAQSLYEKKFITYPRTASRHLSQSVAAEARAHIEATNISAYAKYVASILSKGKLKLSARHADDKKVTDHHAIIPTKQRINGANLSIEEKRIYDLIARRFLAAFYDDAELERTTITTVVEAEKFLTRGSVVVKSGWREVDPPTKNAATETKSNDDEAEDTELPRVAEKDAVETLKAETVAKQTKPPPRFSEASLLGAMETAGKKVEDEELRLAMKDAGLGTPATRAAVIETLIKREFIQREKKALTATEKGAALIAMLPSPLLKSAELTGQWERKLARIAKGEYAFATFMAEVKAMTTQLVEEIGNSTVVVARSNNTSNGNYKQLARPDDALDCPKCRRESREGCLREGFLIERTGANGKFLVCSNGKETCGYLSDAPKNARIRKALLQTACDVCQSAMRLRLPKEQGKRAYLSCVKYPDCTGRRWFNDKGELEAAPVITSKAVNVESAAQIETGPKCATCGTATVKRGPASSGNYFWSCPRWRSDGTGCTSKPLWINAERT